ncbi:Mitochondrial acidic protein mam33 [Knufia obscura]|uniref:Mitochondrial acidic protein mam33 n=2 Tax=Knufia TaxID=430999 RepID=A0AAN8I5H7_9EURO|nr:Mitochondrial acidic protein mam33 [Knufia obscura]KAK5952969.1 Mitochondrial acidic protein mam33 [Knufia fluminis]
MSAKCIKRITLFKIPNPKDIPTALEAYKELERTATKVQDQPGTENIIVTRQFGNETIKVECSIADMNADREADEMDEDSALDDEPDFGSDPTSGGKRTINQSGARGGKIDVAPEDSIAPVDRDADGESGDVGAFPLNLSITIDKGTIGATNIIARSQDGDIEIEYVHFYPRAELIDPKTSEAVKEAQNVYGGPPFPYLDAELQQMYETYVQERGIDTQLSLFLSRYVDYKEQREYVQWLDNMKKFVDA